MPVPHTLLVGMALLALASGAAAQRVFRSGVQTVVVAVTVTDAGGRLVTGLSRDDFEIAEDGVPQPVTQFTDERMPVSLGLLLDASDSMRGQAMDDARLAIDRFVGDLLEPVDQAFVAVFNHLPRIIVPWTSPPASLRARLGDVRPSGGTAIYDAVASMTPIFDRRTHPRAALVVVSDGADTASDRTLTQVRQAIRRSDPFVYAIAIDASTVPASTRVNPDALREIAAPTGGYVEVVRSAEDLGPATARIADELNHQYTLGYSPARPPDGEWRAIRVRVKRDGLLVRARRGYFADPPPAS